MLKKDSLGKIIVPKHYTYKYIGRMLKQLGWDEQNLVEKAIISQSELSKLKNEGREGLTPKKFYKLYKGFGDTCINAAKAVYPELDLTLNEYLSEQRSPFGQYMATHEVIKNSIDVIAVKTGISLSRLKEMYFKTGAPKSYELLLIEKAIGKKTGEVFEELYEEKAGKG